MSGCVGNVPRSLERWQAVMVEEAVVVEERSTAVAVAVAVAVGGFGGGGGGD